MMECPRCKKPIPGLQLCFIEKPAHRVQLPDGHFMQDPDEIVGYELPCGCLFETYSAQILDDRKSIAVVLRDTDGVEWKTPVPVEGDPCPNQPKGTQP